MLHSTHEANTPAPEPAAMPPEAVPAVEQRPPSPRPVAWGNAVCNDGGGVKWGDGAAPAKVEVPEAEPAAQSESGEPSKFGGGLSWG